MGTVQLQRKFCIGFRSFPFIMLKVKVTDVLETAVRAVEKMKQLLPEDPHFHYFLCQLKIRQGKTDEALKLLPFIVKGIGYHKLQNDPVFDPVRNMHGFQQFLREHFPEKYEDLGTFEFVEEKAIYYPGNCAMLAKYYESQKEWHRAKILYEKAISLKPDSLNSELTLGLAEAYLKLGRLDEAKAICSNSIDAIRAESYKIAEDYKRAARVFYKCQLDELAEEFHEKAIVRDSFSNSLFNSIGWFYKNHGDYKQAEHYLNQCIAIKKEYWPPYANLALLYYSFGEKEATWDILENGVAVNPDNTLLREMKTVLSYFALSRQESKAVFEETAQQQPLFNSVWDFLEQVRLKDYAKAIETWKLFKDEILTWYFVHIYLGALTQNGNMEAAVELLNESDIWSLNYQLLATDPLLEPLRNEQAYKDYIQNHFPEKVTDH